MKSRYSRQWSTPPATSRPPKTLITFGKRLFWRASSAMESSRRLTAAEASSMLSLTSSLNSPRSSLMPPKSSLTSSTIPSMLSFTPSIIASRLSETSSRTLEEPFFDGASLTWGGSPPKERFPSEPPCSRGISPDFLSTMPPLSIRESKSAFDRTSISKSNPLFGKRQLSFPQPDMQSAHLAT